MAKGVSKRAADPAAEPDAQLLAALQALQSSHGVAPHVRGAQFIVPDRTVRLRIDGAASIERFVTAARALPGVRDVRVEASHVDVHCVIAVGEAK